MAKSVGVGLVSMSSAFSVGAQGMLDINANIAAAANCAGTMMGNAIGNYDYGVLDEERMRDVVNLAFLYQLSVSFKEEDVEHLNRLEKNYNDIQTAAIGEVIRLYDAGDFDWQHQEEVDKCVARMAYEMLAPFPPQLQRQEDREALRREIDAHIDKMLEVLAAMQ